MMASANWLMWHNPLRPTRRVWHSRGSSDWLHGGWQVGYMVTGCHSLIQLLVFSLQNNVLQNNVREKC
jgi:hypothetical protein